MRGARHVAIAMRSPNKEIIIHKEQLGGIYQSRLAKIPFLRGLVMLWDSLGLGMRALTMSANTQTGEDEKLEGPALYLTLGASLLFAVALFFLAPAALGQLSERYLGLNAWLGNLVEGLVRLALLILYIALIGRMAEIRRVFAYHGAEHKTINAFEAGVELTPENVAQHSVEHPRCGTAFLLTLVVMSIILFSLLGPLPTVWRLASRVLLLPVLAGHGLRVHPLHRQPPGFTPGAPDGAPQPGPAAPDHPRAQPGHAGSLHRRLPGHARRRRKTGALVPHHLHHQLAPPRPVVEIHVDDLLPGSQRHPPAYERHGQRCFQQRRPQMAVPIASPQPHCAHIPASGPPAHRTPAADRSNSPAHTRWSSPRWSKRDKRWSQCPSLIPLSWMQAATCPEISMISAFPRVLN